MTFGHLIRTKRNAIGMSASKLARFCGMNASQVKLIEEGAGCQLKTAYKLLSELGIENIKTEQLQAE